MKDDNRDDQHELDYLSRVRLNDREFNRLSEFIQREFGIKMPPAKKTLLESRLQKRLKFLRLKSFGAYCDYIFSHEDMDEEIVNMMDLVTTNKTDFFREADHFDLLINSVVPELLKNAGAGVRKTFIVWSAGCSTGEEPYTLAMVLSEFATRFPGLGFDYLIIATDLSSRVVEIASKGIYKSDRVEPVSMEMRRKYLLKSKEREKDLVRVVPELRQHVRFRRLNFMDTDYGFRETMDVIFCRNVFIYFDKETQERLLGRLCKNLAAGGYLFLGHSETVTGLDLPLTRVAPSVYRKTG